MRGLDARRVERRADTDQQREPGVEERKGGLGDRLAKISRVLAVAGPVVLAAMSPTKGESQTNRTGIEHVTRDFDRGMGNFAKGIEGMQRAKQAIDKYRAEDYDQVRKQWGPGAEAIAKQLDVMDDEIERLKLRMEYDNVEMTKGDAYYPDQMLNMRANVLIGQSQLKQLAEQRAVLSQQFEAAKKPAEKVEPPSANTGGVRIDLPRMPNFDRSISLLKDMVNPLSPWFYEKKDMSEWNTLTVPSINLNRLPEKVRQPVEIFIGALKELETLRGIEVKTAYELLQMPQKDAEAYAESIVNSRIKKITKIYEAAGNLRQALGFDDYRLASRNLSELRELTDFDLDFKWYTNTDRLREMFANYKIYQESKDEFATKGTQKGEAKDKVLWAAAAINQLPKSLEKFPSRARLILPYLMKDLEELQGK